MAARRGSNVRPAHTPIRTVVIHPDTAVVPISEHIGRGVVATAPIPAGTLVWVQDRFDQVFTPSQFAELDRDHRAILDRYAHLDRDRNRILCWDAGRLVNHACDPSLRGVGPSVMAARVDLRPGDPITCDYAECNLDEPLDCVCGAAECRGTIHGRDLLSLGARWDREAAELRLRAAAVPQPLLTYAHPRERIVAMLAGELPIPAFAEQCAFRADSD